MPLREGSILTAADPGAVRDGSGAGEPPVWLVNAAGVHHHIWVAVGMTSAALAISTPDALAVLRGAGILRGQDLAADLTNQRVLAAVQT